MDNNQKIVLTKLEAAKRQIDTAIYLYFTNGDPVSAHALTFAAMDVLRNYSDAVAIETIFNDFLEHILPERQKEFLDLIRKPQMFFKHANRDPNETIDFRPRAYEIPLLLTCEAYAELTGTATENMELFNAWYLSTVPDLVAGPATYQEVIVKLHEIKGNIEKSLFYETVKGTKDAKNLHYLALGAQGNSKRRKPLKP